MQLRRHFNFAWMPFVQENECDGSDAAKNMTARHYHNNIGCRNCAAENTDRVPREHNVTLLAAVASRRFHSHARNGSLTLQAISVFSVFLFINIPIFIIYLRRNSVCVRIACGVSMSVRRANEQASTFFGYGIYLCHRKLFKWNICRDY